MYYRIDPSKSAGSYLYVMDSDNSLIALKSRTIPGCTTGTHQSLPAAKFIEAEAVHCLENGNNIYTLIYQ